MFRLSSTSRIRTTGRGSFHCPYCADQRAYEHKKTERWLAFYSLPLFPTTTLGERIECGSCRRAYPVALIGRTTDQRNRRQEIGTVVQWRCAMIAVACAFGPPKQCQAEAIGTGMVRHWRQRADVGEIMADCRGVPTCGMALEEVLGRLGDLPQSLRPSDKEHFLQSAREVLRAGEGSERQQQDLLDAIARRLGISEGGMRRVQAA